MDPIPEQSDLEPDAPVTRAPLPVFAARAHARLLDTLGWQVAPSPRREAEAYAPVKCCFILRDGCREEVAFGYTAVTAPLDAGCAELRLAKLRVEYLLTRLGEGSGMLIQNTPLVAFGGRNRDRIAVFGGWRFRSGTWKPFLLGPEGLAGVAAQEVLFAQETAPQHMAEICGHATADAAPHLAGLVREIETLGREPASEGGIASPVAGPDDLETVPFASGWFMARTGRTGDAHAIRQDASYMPMFRHAETPAPAEDDHAAPMFRHLHALSVSGDEPKFRHISIRARTAGDCWNFAADEFRFHEFGMDRG